MEQYVTHLLIAIIVLISLLMCSRGKIDNLKIKIHKLEQYLDDANDKSCAVVNAYHHNRVKHLPYTMIMDLYTHLLLTPSNTLVASPYTADLTDGVLSIYEPGMFFVSVLKAEFVDGKITRISYQDIVQLQGCLIEFLQVVVAESSRKVDNGFDIEEVQRKKERF